MKQLDPKAVWLFFFEFCVVFCAPIIILGWVVFAGVCLGCSGINPFLYFLAIISVVIFLGCLLAFIWAKLTYHFYKYELTDLGFKKEKGVIFKKYTTIPYDRIQNVDIYRGILARLLGLSDLKIQTAGSSAIVSRYGTSGGGSEGSLPGVSMIEAEQLRDELIKRISSKNQGL